ncbi:MAG: hypothetical protein ACOY15_06590 [Pseudomonadota bacterium]
MKIPEPVLRRLSSVLCPSVFCLLTAACGTAYPGSPQACAGVNSAVLAYNAKSGQLDAELCGGKENEHIKLSGETPDGLAFSYEAQGAKAFAGQMTQAELNETLSRQKQETVREIIQGLKSAAPVAPFFIP